MRRTPFLTVVHVTCATIAVLLLLRGPASAQDVTGPALKAAFIYNFARFTEWPADVVPAAEPFVMCVVGDAALGEALERAVKGRVLAGRSMTVSILAPAAPRRGCHLLYLSGVTPAQAGHLVANVRDVPVLTISDVDGFTELGGIVQFFSEQSHLHFSVRLESATRARLQMNPQLLALAKLK